jgi:hypothetical protein
MVAKFQVFLVILGVSGVPFTPQSWGFRVVGRYPAIVPFTAEWKWRRTKVRTSYELLTRERDKTCSGMLFADELIILPSKYELISLASGM